jgi:3-phosphoglycerate kinase
LRNFENKKCFDYYKEIESLNKVLKTAKTGNSSSWIKVSSKITIENILDKVDHMIIGMTFTCKSIGRKIGDSICEDDKLELL